ncbi:Cilia- and flagella-associated protein 70 (Flagellum-associated protein 70) [Durusdinium trenchii]|uniref:Cilia- and flagella-associated protein 70 (Flagellum-associated protein 70) n=1 Tax=Durusdinium trenchii TaxID=1381693 RepID=A0ABP0S3B7_9DINO
MVKVARVEVRKAVLDVVPRELEGKVAVTTPLSDHAELLECSLRCEWVGPGGDENGVGGWKAMSRPWRNTLYRDFEAEEVAGAVHSHRFCSRQFWFQQDVELEALDDASINKFLRATELRLSVLPGKRVSDADVDAGEIQPLAVGNIDLFKLIRADTVEETVKLEVAESCQGANALFSSAQFQVRAKVTPEMADFVLGSHLLSFANLTIPAVPLQFTEAWMSEALQQAKEDAEAAQNSEAETKTGDGNSEVVELNVDQLEALATRVDAACEKLKMEIVLRGTLSETDRDDFAHSSENEGTQESTEGSEEAQLEGEHEQAEAKEEEDICAENESKGPKRPEKPQPFEIRFVTADLVIRFDKENKQWTAASRLEDQKSAQFFLSSATRVLLEKQNRFDQARVVVSRQNVDDAGTASDVEEPASLDVVEASLDCSELFTPDATMLTLKAEDGLAQVQVSNSWSFVQGEISAPALSTQSRNFLDGERPMHSRMAKGQLLANESKALDVLESMARSCREEFDVCKVRQMLLRAVQGDLRFSNNLKGTNLDQVATSLEVRSLQLSSHGSSDAAPSQSQLASEAEFVGDLRRAEQVWSEMVHKDATQLLPFARFCMRNGKHFRALVLLSQSKCSSSNNNIDINGSEATLQVMSHVLTCFCEKLPSVQDLLCDVTLMTHLLRFECGLQDAVDFDALPEDHQPGAPQLASLFRRLAEVALACQLAKVAKVCLMRANASDLEPLIDSRLVRSEQLRARYKILTGECKAAVEILSQVSTDSEQVALLNVPALTRAQTYFYAGEAQERLVQQKQATLQDVRSSYSDSLAVLNEMVQDERDAKLSDASDTAELRQRLTFRLARTYLQLDDARKARLAYRNAVQSDAVTGTLAWAWLGLGRTSMALEDSKVADMALRRALILDDLNPDAWCWMARFQLKEKIMDEAQAALDLGLSVGQPSTSMLKDVVEDLRDHLGSVACKKTQRMLDAVRGRLALVE